MSRSAPNSAERSGKLMTVLIIWFLDVRRRWRRFAVAPVLALACLLAPPVQAQDWSVVDAPGAGDQTKAAATTNADGHKLFIWAKHLEDRSLVFAEVHLEDGNEFAGRMPVYRIDGDDPVDTELVRREGEKQGSLWGFVAGKACFWLIWSSNRETVDASDHLAKWMNGKLLKVTYLASDGSKKDIEFSLAGSLAAIQQATGVNLP
jgi:hypothetical protein